MDAENTTRILGLDTGTNSIGWAVVDRRGDECSLIDQGVHIFSEGVKIEKGIESSKAADRTQHRGQRRGYYRRKLRKIRLLRILSDLGWCPYLSPQLLSQWRLDKVYPLTEDFKAWQATDDINGINPYQMRVTCLHTTLDLSQQSQRYILGRALYHLAQRRGFMSNRKDQDKKDEESGKVKGGISDLSKEMAAAGCEYLADYFNLLYNRGERIRAHYTSRKDHYLKEFKAICSRQNIDDATAMRLEKAIFDQRPLKSQKQAVGHCPFERSKTRCPISHPDFEEMRMLQMINGIRIQMLNDATPRQLTDEERAKVEPLFYRKSKHNFDFKDIAVALSKGQGSYGYLKTDPEANVLFNYPMDTSVAGSPMTAGFAAALGNDWKDVLYRSYTKRGGKSVDEVVNDVWHALTFFDDNDRLREWLMENLQVAEDVADKLVNITVPQGYASLSHKAIKNILPYLRRGVVYSHAVLLGNLSKVMPAYEWGNPDMRRVAIEMAIDHLNAYDRKTDPGTLDDWLKAFLEEKYHVGRAALKQLYHPSQLETYPRVRPDDDGRMRLGSPRISAVRNPMAMRSLFRIREVVNKLLETGVIDKHTEVHVEFGRELNDANMRTAIYATNRENQKKRDEARDMIAEQLGCAPMNVSDTDVSKYLLLEEQKGVCFYTGEQIGIEDLFGDNPKYDIEHTIPRSAGGDSTLENLTLCQSRFNREVKKTLLPSQLPNADEIMLRVAFMKNNADDLSKQIRRCRTNPSMDKAQKDRIIAKRHKLELARNYWLNKYRRFEMTEVPEGFSRRQGASAGTIARYARLYLKSLFDRVDVVKGAATADFRKAWGLQAEWEKKSRDNHTHHEIDAIVIACIGLGDYQRLAASYHVAGYADRELPQLPAPWPTFEADIRRMQQQTLVSHDNVDNMPKQGRRRILTSHGRELACGDAARGSLHQDTVYGAIEVNGETLYVVRKPVSAITKASDVENIVDPVVRQKVKEAIEAKGLKQAIAEPIWMNEEKGVQIKKVRMIAQQIKRPIAIRKHRDVSAKEYKRCDYVASDGNYAIAIYRQRNVEKGRPKSSFKLFSNLDAARFYAKSNEEVRQALYPANDEAGNPLYAVLKIGDAVLLYENSPEEIYSAPVEDLQKRLYIVNGLSSMIVSGRGYGVITMKHSQESRPFSELKRQNSAYVQGENIVPLRLLLHTQFKALVQNVDFRLDVLGKITFLKHD